MNKIKVKPLTSNEKQINACRKEYMIFKYIRCNK